MATPLAHKDALDQAATLIKQGGTAQGEQILRQILQAEPNNVLALLWMTRCTEDPSCKVALFNRVLSLDPNNPHALKGVELYAKSKEPPASPPPRPAPWPPSTSPIARDLAHSSSSQPPERDDDSDLRSPLAEAAPEPSPASSYRRLLIAIAVLLALLLVLSTTQLVMNLQANAARGERAAAAEQFVQSQQSLITDLLTDYQDAAYDDPDVETIYQQQLIASEHILIALHLIAIQNSQVIELLAATP